MLYMILMCVYMIVIGLFFTCVYKIVLKKSLHDFHILSKGCSYVIIWFSCVVRCSSYVFICLFSKCVYMMFEFVYMIFICFVYIVFILLMMFTCVYIIFQMFYHMICWYVFIYFCIFSCLSNVCWYDFEKVCRWSSCV